MRLNNHISSTGICSRRQADELIKQNKVTINGKIAKLGSIVSDKDDVKVNGKPLHKRPPNIYIALNKPVGITCTTERHVKGNIIDYINHTQRIFPIGRLDKDSEGLILLTNDGSIVNKILREENNHEKDYLVTVNKSITAAFLEGMSKGVRIFNPVEKKFTKTKPCKVLRLNEKTFKITLSQGLNRQIRRMCEAFDYDVLKLKRSRIMHVDLKGLKYGQWRYLTEEEIKKIKLD